MATDKQKLAAQKMAENVRNGNPKTKGEILKESGYTESVSESPTKVTNAKGFQELMEEYLPDDEVMRVHQELLTSTRIDHMVFPLGSKHKEEIPLEGDIPEGLEEKLKDSQSKNLSDDEIREMIAEIGCKVRRIVHGETARHVYFWSPDANTRKAAVELAYKIKGRITNKVQFNGELRVNPYKDLTTEELRKLAEGGNGEA